MGIHELGAQCRDTLVKEGFESRVFPPTSGGTWQQTALNIDSSGTFSRTGSRAYAFNAKADALRTPRITQSARLTLWFRRSATSFSHNFNIQTSSDSLSWTTIQTVNATNGFTFTTTYQSVSVNVNDVYVRILDNRGGGSGSSSFWYLDDVYWTSDTTTGVWTGDASNIFDDPANWCQGVVPDGVDKDWLIPSGVSNFPIVSSAVTIRNLTISPGASLIHSGGTLKITGNINSANGYTFSSGSGILEMGGSSPQVLRGSYFKDKIALNIRISNPAGLTLEGLNDSLKLRQALSFGAGNCILNTNGNLVLLSSTSSNTARILDLTAGGLYSGNRILGNVTVERYIPFVSGRNARWQFLGVPTKGQTINAAWQEGNAPGVNSKPGFGTIITSNLSNPTSLGFDGFSANGPGMKYYDAATSSFIGVASTSQLIDTEKGYMLFVRGNRSVTNSSQTPTAAILRTYGQLYTPIDNPPPVIQVPAGKFQSVNNFYACAVNFSGLLKTGSIQDAYYIWDPSLAGLFGRGGYQTFSWDGTTYIASPGGGNFSSGNNAIESGSAFFVKDTGTGGSIRFVEAAKVNQARMIFRTASSSPYSSIRLNIAKIDSSEQSLLDGVVSYFNTDFSPAVNAMDIPKISLDEGISISRDGQILAAEYSYHDTTFYFINKLTKAKYQLGFSFTEMSKIGKVCVLYDRFLNSSKILPMKDSGVVSFEVTDDPASSKSDRFFLVIKKLENGSRNSSLAANP